MREMRISLPFATITNYLIVFWTIFILQAVSPTSIARNGDRHIRLASVTGSSVSTVAIYIDSRSCVSKALKAAQLSFRSTFSSKNSVYFGFRTNARMADANRTDFPKKRNNGIKQFNWTLLALFCFSLDRQSNGSLHRVLRLRTLTRFTIE